MEASSFQESGHSERISFGERRFHKILTYGYVIGSLEPHSPLVIDSVRVGKDPAADGPTNMARDLEMVQGLATRTLAIRVYSWTGLWVTLGRFQTARETLRDPANTPHTIRPTGGRAVLHGHDATVAIGYSFPPGEAARAVRRLYRQLTTPLAAALTECGLPARLAEDAPGSTTEGTLHPDCFAGTSRNDVVNPATRKKVCGCALRVWNDRVLLQASIPAGVPLRAPEEVFFPPILSAETPNWAPDGLVAALERQFALP